MARNTRVDRVGHAKKALLDALEASLGIVTIACRNVGVSRSTFYNYVSEDPVFAESVKGLEEVVLDFAESQLHKQIKEGIPSSTIFFLKTRGRKRGYIERTEHTGADGEPLIPSKIVIEIVGDTPPVTSEEDIKDPTQ